MRDCYGFDIVPFVYDIRSSLPTRLTHAPLAHRSRPPTPHRPARHLAVQAGPRRRARPDPRRRAAARPAHQRAGRGQPPQGLASSRARSPARARKLGPRGGAQALRRVRARARRERGARPLRDAQPARRLRRPPRGALAAGTAPGPGGPARRLDRRHGPGRRGARRAALLRREPALSLGHHRSGRQPATGGNLSRRRAEAASVPPEEPVPRCRHACLDRRAPRHLPRAARLQGRQGRRALRGTHGAPCQRCLHPAANSHITEGDEK